MSAWIAPEGPEAGLFELHLGPAPGGTAVLELDVDGEPRAGAEVRLWIVTEDDLPCDIDSGHERTEGAFTVDAAQRWAVERALAWVNASVDPDWAEARRALEAEAGRAAAVVDEIAFWSTDPDADELGHTDITDAVNELLEGVDEDAFEREFAAGAVVYGWRRQAIPDGWLASFASRLAELASDEFNDEFGGEGFPAAKFEQECLAVLQRLDLGKAVWSCERVSEVTIPVADLLYLMREGVLPGARKADRS